MHLASCCDIPGKPLTQREHVPIAVGLCRERTGDGDAGLVDGRVEGNQEGNPEGQGGMGGAALPQPAGSPFHLHSRSGGLRVMELL